MSSNTPDHKWESLSTWPTTQSAQLSRAQSSSESPRLAASSLAITDVTASFQTIVVSHNPMTQPATTQKSGDIPSTFNDPTITTATPTNSKAKTSTPFTKTKQKATNYANVTVTKQRQLRSTDEELATLSKEPCHKTSQESSTIILR